MDSGKYWVGNGSCASNESFGEDCRQSSTVVIKDFDAPGIEMESRPRSIVEGLIILEKKVKFEMFTRKNLESAN